MSWGSKGKESKLRCERHALAPSKSFTHQLCPFRSVDSGIDYNHPNLGGGFGPDFKVIGGYDLVGDDGIRRSI